MIHFLLAQTTQGDYPTSIKTILFWIGGIVAVLVAIRVLVWPALKALIRDVMIDVAGVKKELQGVKQAVQTNSQATAQLIDANKTISTTPDVDPTVEKSVKDTARFGTGPGTGPAADFRQ